MNDASVLELLARADDAAVLPRLGGMARADGVAIVTDGAWALAAVDGAVCVRNLPRRRTLERIPFVRGLVKLAVALVPLFARGGRASRGERLLLVLLLAAPAGMSRLPHVHSVAGFALTTLALAAWVFRGRTLFLHGAEHRAIAAAETRTLVRTWNSE